jgi:hypothetical protein
VPVRCQQSQSIGSIAVYRRSCGGEDLGVQAENLFQNSLCVLGGDLPIVVKTDAALISPAERRFIFRLGKFATSSFRISETGGLRI